MTQNVHTMDGSETTRQTQPADLRALAQASREGQLHRIFAVPEEVLDALENWAESLAATGDLEGARRVAEGVVALDGTRDGAAEVVRRAEKPPPEAAAEVSATNQGGERC